MAKNFQAKHWVFTIQVPDSAVDEGCCKGHVDRIWGEGAGLTYLCVGGPEVAPQTGKKHYHGYLVASKKIYRKALLEKVGDVWCEPAGTVDAAILYCQKEGTWHERGRKPASGNQGGAATKAKWVNARKAAESGDLTGVDDSVFIQHYQNLNAIVRDHMKRPAELGSTCGYWITGPSGCGKSRYARARWPTAYDKNLSKWWCGYPRGSGAPALLDDLDKFNVSFGGDLKRWADRYPFTAEHKGGASSIRPSAVIVTSQYRIEDIWDDAETRSALQRRFEVIVITDANHGRQMCMLVGSLAAPDVGVMDYCTPLSPLPLSRAEEVLGSDWFSMRNGGDDAF